MHGVDGAKPLRGRRVAVERVVPERLPGQEETRGEVDVDVGEAGVEVARVHEHAVHGEGEVRVQEARVATVVELEGVGAGGNAVEVVLGGGGERDLLRGDGGATGASWTRGEAEGEKSGAVKVGEMKVQKRHGRLALAELQRQRRADLLRVAQRVHREGGVGQHLVELPEHLPISAVDGEAPRQARLDGVGGVEGARRVTARQLHVLHHRQGAGTVLEGRKRHAGEGDAVEKDFAQLNEALTPEGGETDLQLGQQRRALREHGEAALLAALEEVHAADGGERDPAPAGQPPLERPANGVIVWCGGGGDDAVLVQIEEGRGRQLHSELEATVLQGAAPLRQWVAVEEGLRREAGDGRRGGGDGQRLVGQRRGARQHGLQQNGDG